MHKFYFLILAGLLGYIAYPFVPPKLLGLKENAEKEEVSKPRSQGEVKEIVENPMVIPDAPIKKEEVESKKLGSHRMGKRNEITEIEEVPEFKELGESDFSRIITSGIEEGKFIDFRKDNIITWKLKEQVFTLQKNEYQGEVDIELGTIFGPELRRANVVITDEEISSWRWIEATDKE